MHLSIYLTDKTSLRLILRQIFLEILLLDSIFFGTATKMSSRKRKWTRKEALEVIKKHQKHLQLAAEEICEEMLLCDFHDEEATTEIDRLERTILNVRVALGKLRDQDKRRKFRHKQEALEETFVKSSQYSIFDSKQEIHPESSLKSPTLNS